MATTYPLSVLSFTKETYASHRVFAVRRPIGGHWLSDFDRRSENEKVNFITFVNLIINGMLLCPVWRRGRRIWTRRRLSRRLRRSRRQVKTEIMATDTIEHAHALAT